MAPDTVRPTAVAITMLLIRRSSKRPRPASPAGTGFQLPRRLRHLALTVDPPKDVVRRGYDALSYRYRGDDEEPERYGAWLAQLRERLPAGGAVLDLGCGCGVPLARDLAAGGYAVTGVDLSAVQVGRARRLVPTATFLHADATQVEFPASSLDAVISLYTLIHMPLDEQPPLLGRVGRWLRPGGRP